MKQSIQVPSAGESVTQATIGPWQKKTGDYVHQNEVIVIMETDKASMDLTAQHSGQLNILKQEGEEVQIGEVIGQIDTSAKAPAPVSSVPVKDLKPTPSASPVSRVQPAGLVLETMDQSTQKNQVKKTGFLPSDQQLIEGLLNKKGLVPNQKVQNQKSLSKHKNPHLSPAVRKLVVENNLNTDSLPATGPKGRITKGDVLAFLSQKKSVPQGVSDLSSRYQNRPPPFTTQDLGQKREKMSLLRRRIAERLVESQHSTATLTTFNEVDMSHIINLRQQYKEMFQKKHGIKLGFMGFFIKSVVYALQSYPKVNAFIDGNEIVYNSACHIGVAVSTDRGLVVPVIRHAEQKNLSKLEQEVLFYAQKARDGKINPDDLAGGTFTISNGGVFGSLMSTPILNPPQSGILGMHRIEQRPVALEGKVEIRPMMYVALSYDHRMVDGRESVSFLLKIKECIEEPMRLMLSL